MSKGVEISRASVDTLIRYEQEHEFSIEEMECIVQKTIKRGNRKVIEHLLDVCRQAAFFGKHLHPEKAKASKKFVAVLEEALEKLNKGVI